MVVNLYKLHYAHIFKGEQVAIYVKFLALDDFEIFADAMEVLNGVNIKVALRLKLKIKSDFYNDINRRQLLKIIAHAKRAKKIIENTNNVNKAIFLESTYKVPWIGEHVLYYNKYFDEIKTDFPIFSGCEPIGVITFPKGIITYD